ncbi:BspA family leucine-rich repeat surface protein [Eubacterium oxidoreducens]|uniref:Surface protein n=1 Tax=Eubacterium oxidoreducens TaxID=1732 RepID=A0A1G6CSH0_EUBOX|nr:BspA family leucine-rich repeat surface protein [Eubacterium oxidoreducens]SDB35803.1 surface protein [Eubacterium oxidoreducens]
MKLRKRIITGFLCAGLGFGLMPATFGNAVQVSATEAQTDISLGTDVTGAIDEDGTLTISVSAESGVLDKDLFLDVTETYTYDLKKIKMADSSASLYLPEDCSNLFQNCVYVRSIDTTGWNTSNVTTMEKMFSACNYLSNLDVSGFDTSNVTDMSYMFDHCEYLRSIDVTGFDTSKVTSMNEMFESCIRLSDLDISNFDTSNVTAMGCMFDGCRVLQELDLDNFNTSNVTDMYGMFACCEKLQELDLDSFDTSKVTDMSKMFLQCKNLSKVDVSSFDTSSVIEMYAMFRYCTSLKTLDLKVFNTENVTDMEGMFEGCSSLKTLDISQFNTKNVNYMSNMFEGCYKLKTLKTPAVTGDVTTEFWTYYMDGSKNKYTSLPKNQTKSIVLYLAFNIEDANITIPKESYTYTGKAIKPTVTVEYPEYGNLTLNTDYTVKYSSNKKTGTATVTVTGKGTGFGTQTIKFNIEEAENPMVVKAKTATVKYSKLKKKSQKLKVSKVLKVSKAKGTVGYIKESGNKKIKINEKTGNVTVKKGLKKGTYKVKVEVWSCDLNYQSASIIKTFKIKVK